MMAIEGLYISEKGLRAAKALKLDSASRKGVDVHDIVREAEEVFQHPGDFDAVYLWLLRLWLADAPGIKEAHVRTSAASPKSVQRGKQASTEDQIVKVNCLLDLELADRNGSGIISEHAVATLLNFHRAFREVMSYPTKLDTLDLGCVVMGFAVRIPQFRQVAAFYKRPADLIGKDIVSNKLQSETWNKVCRNFKVIHSDISLPPVEDFARNG